MVLRVDHQSVVLDMTGGKERKFAVDNLIKKFSGN